MGTMIVVKDGQRVEVEIPETPTAEQVAAELRASGVTNVHVMTPAEALVLAETTATMQEQRCAEIEALRGEIEALRAKLTLPEAMVAGLLVVTLTRGQVELLLTALDRDWSDD